MTPPPKQEIKCPKKRNVEYIPKYQWESYQKSNDEGFNACHDQFMKVINEQPSLVALDEEELINLWNDILNKNESPNTLRFIREIISKFGAPSPTVLSVEEIERIIVNLQPYMMYDKSQFGQEAYSLTLAQSIHQKLIGGK